MKNELTNKKFWEEYWDSKRLYLPIKKNYVFDSIFQEALKNKKYKTMIEVGGFPGNYAVYFHKYWSYETTLLDYVVNLKVINYVLEINKLSKDDIKVIKADILNYKGSKKYDVVFSLGFVEHFINIEEIIKKHWKMVKKGGTMIIGLPNLLGINGVYQLLFDPSNLNIHNLDCMNIQWLKDIVKRLKPSTYKIYYVSGAMVWLENINKRKAVLRIFTNILKIVGLILTRFGVQNKYISTHIFIVAEK